MEVFSQMPQHISFDVFVVYVDANTKDSDEEYFYAEFMDSSSSNDDKGDTETTMMMEILDETSMSRSIFSTSRVQRRDIKC